MPDTIAERFKHAWNAFMNKDPTPEMFQNFGPSFSYRPDRPRFGIHNERTIIASIYNRISVDVAAIDIEHVRLDENKRFVEEIKSGLNNCLTLDANLDQTARAFVQDIVVSMFDEGCVAIVPIDTNRDPEDTSSFDILSLRTGKIKQWYPHHVRIEVYNENKAVKEEITLPKDKVAIVENPFYAVMNEYNSTLQRLIRKLNLMDVVDEQSSSGKLNLIVQLPYVIKTEGRKTQAENRRKDIEQQLGESKYGIAYTDGTERITQLSKPIENRLLETIEYLTKLLYAQLGMTPEVLDGTADEKIMLNYYSRTIEPILSAITDEMNRKFLSKTARTQHQAIKFFKDPFKLVPVNQLADIVDSFTRNEILTSNEVRQIIGMKPSSDPNADQLRNKNLSVSDAQMEAGAETGEQVELGQNGEPVTEEEYKQRISELDKIDKDLDGLERMVE